MLNSLNDLWDHLPIDTVIASILDPRTKWFEQIPKHEITEAIQVLKQEYLALFRKQDNSLEEINDGYMGGLFGVSDVKQKKMTPIQSWNQDINLFQSLPKASPRADPLLWWKTNQHQFPLLANLAKMYLAIPASQASCERLFSISKNDITETRTSMLPDLVEALLFLRKKRDIINILNQ